MTTTLKEAQTRLEELLDKVTQGQDVVITRDDGSAFKIVASPAQATQKRGGLGFAKGKIRIAEDFKTIPEGFEDDLQEVWTLGNLT